MGTTLVPGLGSTTPVANGGTGATTAAGARSNLAVPGLADANVFSSTNQFQNSVYKKKDEYLDNLGTYNQNFVSRHEKQSYATNVPATQFTLTIVGDKTGMYSGIHLRIIAVTRIAQGVGGGGYVEARRSLVVSNGVLSVATIGTDVTGGTGAYTVTVSVVGQTWTVALTGAAGGTDGTIFMEVVSAVYAPTLAIT